LFLLRARRVTGGKTTSTITISPFLPQSGPNACAQRNETGSPETTSKTLSIATSHQPRRTPPVRPARGDLGSQNTGGREILGFAPPSPVEQQGSLTEPPGRPLVAFHRADLNNRPRPKAVVLSRPPEGVFCVWLPPLGAWNRSGLSFLTPLSIGFSGDHESSAFLYHRRPSQSWYRLRKKHAGSLEALRVTRPEAVDSVSIEQGVSISPGCFVPRPALRVACAPGVASAQRSGSDPVRLTTRLQGSAEEPIGLHASLR